MRRAALAATVVVALAVGSTVTTARAEPAPYVDDGSLPWASGATQRSALETFLSGLVDERLGATGREVRCEGTTDWASLGRERGFDPETNLGYVRFTQPQRNGVAIGLWSPDHLVELAPFVCSRLQRFAIADPKPTTCQGVTTVVETVERSVPVRVTRKVTVRVPMKVRTRVKVAGVWKTVTKTVLTPVVKTVTETVTRTETTTVAHDAPGAFVPCYPRRPAGASVPASYFTEYADFTEALLAMGHETIHLSGVTDEDIAECRGLQSVAWWAGRLGADTGDAAAIALYAWQRIYPAKKGSAYFSDHCVDGGALDLSPGDGVWP